MPRRIPLKHVLERPSGSTIILRRGVVPYEAAEAPELHYTCGRCDRVLATAEARPRVAGLLFVCPRCGATNAFEEARPAEVQLPGDPPSWSQALAIGHPSIDAQHRQIFARVEALHRAMSAGERRDLAGLVDFLGAYVIDHFTDEEHLMRGRGYPGLAGHVGQHSRFIHDFTALRDDLLARGASDHLVRKTRAWLVEWLRWHIMGADAALGVFLRTGLRAAQDRP